jgi:hypothetical protein
MGSSRGGTGRTGARGPSDLDRRTARAAWAIGDRAGIDGRAARHDDTLHAHRWSDEPGAREEASVAVAAVTVVLLVALLGQRGVRLGEVRTIDVGLPRTDLEVGAALGVGPSDAEQAQADRYDQDPHERDEQPGSRPRVYFE